MSRGWGIWSTRMHKLTRGEAAQAVDELLEYSQSNLTRDFRQRLAEILEESGTDPPCSTVPLRAGSALDV